MKLYIILAFATLFTYSHANRLFCYWGSWSIYRNGPAKFRAEDIDPTLCTHIVFTFVGLERSGRVRILDPYNDVGDQWNEGAFSKLQKLRLINPEVKILCAIGGWNEGSEKYSFVVNNPSLRKVMVNSIVETTLKYGFDGFDVDWEYPGQRGGAPTDREAYSALLGELSQAFKPLGLILSAAVSANAVTSPGSYNCKDLVTYLDFINVMSYDLHGSWEPFTGHHTAMCPHPKDPLKDHYLCVDRAMKYWVDCTGDPSKLNIGLALYGRSFSLANENNHGVRAPSTGPGNGGSYIGEPGFLGYNEFCMEQTKGLWKVYDIPEQLVRYAVKGKTWLGYDDEESITQKVHFARSLNISGAMVWSVETDDFRGDCGRGKYPLLRAILSAFDWPMISTATPPTTSENPSTTTSTSLSPFPTLPDDGTDFSHMCKYVGHIFKNPKDECSFFMCTYKGIGTELKAVCIKCPDSLVFDESQNVCNYKRSQK